MGRIYSWIARQRTAVCLSWLLTARHHLWLFKTAFSFGFFNFGPMPHASETLSPAQQQFLTQVLGLSIPVEPVSGALLPVWERARQSADTQMVGLVSALNATGFEIMKEVANSGIDSLTDGPAAALSGALSAYDAGNSTAAAVQSAIAKMRKTLNGQSIIALLDANPLKIPVSLQATLGQALDQIDASLE